MFAKEIRNKTQEELKEQLEALRKEAESLSTEILKGKEKNLRKMKFLRRDVARVLTVLKEQSNKEKNA